jgi:hypothetical protein
MPLTDFVRTGTSPRRFATLYDVPTVFFLQPHAGYNYDTHLFRDQALIKRIVESKPSVTGIYEQLKADKEYIDLSGLFVDWEDRKAIVDNIHYSPGFNKFLAQHVAEFIEVHHLRPRDMEAPTGGVRTQ